MAYRHFAVTVTPDVVLYADGWRGGEYTKIVSARTREEAIKWERRERRLEDGGSGVKFAYRARLASPEEIAAAAYA
jgi:hypothetical protein